MSCSIIVKKDNVDALLKSVKLLVRSDVLVGIPDSAAERERDEDDEENLSNAEIGYIQETGSPARNIPPRPFLVPGVNNAREAIAEQMKKGGLAAAALSSLDNARAAIDRAQHATGLVAQNAVKQKITEGPFSPLSSTTLAKRRKKGRTGIKPLIDTGQLRAAVTYVVRNK